MMTVVARVKTRRKNTVTPIATPILPVCERTWLDSLGGVFEGSCFRSFDVVPGSVVPLNGNVLLGDTDVLGIGMARGPEASEVVPSVRMRMIGLAHAESSLSKVNVRSPTVCVSWPCGS